MLCIYILSCIYSNLGRKQRRKRQFSSEIRATNDEYDLAYVNNETAVDSARILNKNIEIETGRGFDIVDIIKMVRLRLVPYEENLRRRIKQFQKNLAITT